jgi:hypothetical protein
MTDQTTIEPPLSQQLATIDAPMERKRVGDMVINKWAGLTFAEYREAVEFAKLMSQGKYSIPGYLKQNAGDCLATITQALRWKLEPYWVAQHSYIAPSKDQQKEPIICYDSAVHNAIVLASNLLKERPRYHFDGEGPDRVCTVSATFKGEATALTYTTPPLKTCKKNSPLWTTDPDQQLGYYAIRSWGRRYMPDLLAGVYSTDEFEETTQNAPSDSPPSPNLLQRLPGRMSGEGFKASDHVTDEEIAEEIKAAPKKAHAAAEKAVEEPSENPAPPQQPVEDKPAWEAPMAEATVQTSPPPPARPQTAGEYQAYAMAWIEKHTDPDEIEARWEGQMDMRRDLKVPLPMRKQLESVMKARVNTLRGK